MKTSMMALRSAGGLATGRRPGSDGRGPDGDNMLAMVDVKAMKAGRR